MKIYLPKLVILFILFICSVYITSIFSPSVHAAVATPTPSPTITVTPTGSGTSLGTTVAPTDFVEDQEVTFIGKNAARSGLLLDWMLSDKNFGWVYLKPDSAGQPSENPLLPFWATIRNIVFALLGLFVLAAAFVLIATRGRSITIRRFIVRFVIIAVLVYFSFSILQLLYELADIAQKFFLVSPTYAPNDISQKDLLSVGWDYSTFVGLRATDPSSTEAAFIALLLVKLTAITYYVMVGILLLRKIILWFFIILSPIFPLLLFFQPIRNTAKIWVGEFFRWLLYAPLFAILLAGLVHVWVAYIPLNFTDYTPSNSAFHTPADVTNGDLSKPDSFPTAINILLGGPHQALGLTNSVNYIETFAEYVVALLMLWVVILLPFILLQIFLDYLNTLSINENGWVQQLVARSPSFLNPPPVTPGSPKPPTKYQPAGLAKALPFGASFKMTNRVNEAVQSPQTVNVRVGEKANAEILQLTNLSVPSMRDIAAYETSVLQTGSGAASSHVEQTLAHIANPSSAMGTQQDAYRQIRNKLMNESQRGNALAKNILQAAATSAATNIGSQTATLVQQAINTIFNPASAITATEQIKAQQLRQVIVQESEKGNATATNVVTAMNAINKAEMANISQMLTQIAKPQSISNATKQATFVKLHDALTEESQKGDTVATSILTAATTISTKGVDVTTVTKVREQLKQESQKGNKLAADLLATSSSTDVMSQVQLLLKSLQDAKQKGDPLATNILQLFAEKGVQTTSSGLAGLPTSNRLQTVSIEDYEAVRHMWMENYEKMDIPTSIDGDRKAWLQSDIDDITQTINLLSSSDQQQVATGMQRVSSILPFLLIGGFSQTEIIAYLKAKQQAAKEVLANVAKKEDEEETQVERTTTTQTTGQAQQAMSMEASQESQTSENK